MISLIREEYTGRLNTVGDALSLVETQVFNDRGDLLLAKGLKVRHKLSGYEYTVDHVEGSEENAVVFLRHPDVPRFQPPPSDEPLNEQSPDELVDDSEVPLDVPAVLAKKSDEQAGMLRVTLDDFENEYEVD
jgi:hypothetical protein